MNPNVTNKLYTIEQYAKYVIDNPAVQAIVKRFYQYQRLADLSIDTLRGATDFGLIKLEEADQKPFQEVLQDIEASKERRLREILEKSEPSYWIHFSLRRIIRGQPESKLAVAIASPLPTVNDVPLIMFNRFLRDPDFKDYLFTGTIRLIGGAYFAREKDLARQMYTVFALFLWLRTVGVHDLKRGEYSYYDWPSSKVSAKPGQAEYDADSRLEFLEEYKKYIHLDLYNANEYALKQKEGSVLRLRFSGYQTGQIVIQSCGEKSNECNVLLDVTSKTLTYIHTNYQPEDQVLTPFQTPLLFHCAFCHLEKASFLQANKIDKPVFYCGETCFIASQKAIQ